MTYTVNSGEQVKFSLTPTEEEATLQNLYCMLQTTLGEVPCYREFGIDKSYIHMPTNVGQTVALSAIAEGLMKFFPEMDLGTVDFSEIADHPGTLSAKIEVTDGYE